MSEIRPGYKQTEVGVIPEDWEERTVGSVCLLINGRGFKPFEWKIQGLPIIRIQNLNGSDDYNYYDGSYDKKIEVNNSQLLFAWSGSRGTSFGPHVWHGATSLLNYHTWKVNVNEEKVDKDFFLHALRQLTKYIEDNAHGASALVHTQKWEMESFKFPLPPTLAEQTAIAAVLSDTDTLIQKLDQLIAKKRNVKQGTMQELLTGKRRLPGFSGEWEVKKLGEVADIDSDNLGSTTDPGYVFKYISLECVDNGILKTYSEQEFQYAPSRARRKIKRGDILVSTVRPNLKSHMCFSLDSPNWICSTGFSVVRCNAGQVNSDYIFQHFFADTISNQIDTLLTGSNYPAINSKDVRDLRILLPPTLAEQTAIATVLSDMDAEIVVLEQKRDKYKAVKQGMMQVLLTGKVRLV